MFYFLQFIVRICAKVVCCFLLDLCLIKALPRLDDKYSSFGFEFLYEMGFDFVENLLKQYQLKGKDKNKKSRIYCYLKFHLLIASVVIMEMYSDSRFFFLEDIQIQLRFYLE